MYGWVALCRPAFCGWGDPMDIFQYLGLGLWYCVTASQPTVLLCWRVHRNPDWGSARYRARWGNVPCFFQPQLQVNTRSRHHNSGRNLLRLHVRGFYDFDFGQYPRGGRLGSNCLDGYQMARKGRAGPALGIAAFASFIAGTFSIPASCHWHLRFQCWRLKFVPLGVFQHFGSGIDFVDLFGSGFAAQGTLDGLRRISFGPHRYRFN